MGMSIPTDMIAGILMSTLMSTGMDIPIATNTGTSTAVWRTLSIWSAVILIFRKKLRQM